MHVKKACGIYHSSSAWAAHRSSEWVRKPMSRWRNCHMVILNHTASWHAKSSRLILSNILHFKTGELVSEKGAIESIMGKGWHTWPFDVSRASFTSRSMMAGEQGNPVMPHSITREQTDGQLSVSNHLQHLPFSIFFIHCWNESFAV